MRMAKHPGMPSFLIISFIITLELIVISRARYIYTFFLRLDRLLIRARLKASRLQINYSRYYVFSIPSLIIIFYTLYKLRDKLYGTYYEEDYIWASIMNALRKSCIVNQNTKITATYIKQKKSKEKLINEIKDASEN